ncbi:MAG: hypothetical protein WD872_17390 [Pirellulaceae bacterium]
MELAIEILGRGGVVPAACAAQLVWLASRFRAAEPAGRYAAAVAIAAAFGLGYVLLPDWAALVPQRHWQWLPYLALLAAVLGPVARAAGVQAFERWLLALLLAVAAAWVLVPAWSDLVPARGWSIALLAAYLLALSMALDALPERLAGPRLLGLFALAAGALAIVLLVSITAKLGQVAGVAAAAIAGAWTVAGSFERNEALLSRAAVPLYAVLVGGLAYVGAIEVPGATHWELLVLPAAPLALWVFAAGPLAKLQGWAALATQIGLVLLPIVAVAAWVVLGE